MAQVVPEAAVEAGLIAACHTEGMEGLADFYQTYAPPVRALCLARLGDRALAEDACHDTILKAYGAAGRFWPGAKVWPWLSTIASNVCTDIQRRQHREVIAGLIPDERSDLGEPGADDRAQARMHSDLVTDALRRLSPRQRELLYRYEYQGYSYQEMAELTGSSLPAVRTALMRARQSLRAKVEELAEERPSWPLAIAAIVGRVPGRIRAWAVRAGSRVRHASLTKPEMAGHLAAAAALTVCAATGIGSVGGDVAAARQISPVPVAADRSGVMSPPVAGAVSGGIAGSFGGGASSGSSGSSGSGHGSGLPPLPPSGGNFHFHGPGFVAPVNGPANTPSGINVGTINVNCDQVTQSNVIAGAICPIVTHSPLVPSH
jgi:RNA polymerase sigma-70 factor (ECF subfamily)